MDNFVIQTYGKRRENQGVLGGVIFVTEKNEKTLFLIFTNLREKA